MNIAFMVLPQFEILQVEKTDSVIKCSGVIRNIGNLSRVEPDWIVTICVAENRFIKGRFTEVNSQDFQASISVNDLGSQEFFVAGKVYPLLDSFWGDLAELVFNNSLLWKKVRFEPQDSAAHYADSSVEIIKGGWDHEHCEICGQTTSLYEADNHYGYVSERDNWLCESCYQKYVLNKSLDFINLDQVF